MDKPPDNVKPLYRETLDPIAKERYRQKMELMGNIDPYEVSSGWLSDMDTLSDVTYPDIVNYRIIPIKRPRGRYILERGGRLLKYK